MGYCMHQANTKFMIKKDKFEDARKSVLELAGEEPITDDSGPHFSWVRPGWEKLPFLEMLEEWRWTPKLDAEGNIENLNFEGEKLGDEELLFQQLAPFVEAGCYIEMWGEEADRWRWSFDGNKLRIVWE